MEIASNKIPFSVLLKFQLASCHHELYNILNDQGHGGKQNRRKQILEFLVLYRKRFFKLLVLCRIPVADTIVQVHEFIDTQDRQIEQSANELFSTHNQLMSVQLPPHDLKTAIDVLGTGSYRQLPLSLQNRFVPMNPPSPEETHLILQDLQNIIRVRLLCDEVLPIPFKRSMVIDSGCVTFTVQDEFSVKLTLFLGEKANVWKLINLNVLCSSPAEADYEGMNEIHPIHISTIMQELQNYFNNSVDNKNTIEYLYDKLHIICLTYQLEMLAAQADYLSRNRWADLKVSKASPSLLSISFWNPTTFQRAATFVLNISSDVKENEPMSLNVLTPLKKELTNICGVSMTSLDVEIILSSATERVALNITNWWHEELIGVGFRAQIISSSFNHNGFDATMMRLEVEITPSFSVQITLNPRSGFASVSMAHLIQVPDVDLDMILSLGISRAQALLNGDHTKIVAALCKISLAMCLQSIHSLAVQVGFKMIQDHSFSENEFSSRIGDSLFFILESPSLEDVKICFSVDEAAAQTRSPYSDVSCKGWIFVKEISLVLEIKPSDVQKSTGAFGTTFTDRKWKNMSEYDLIDIYRFALQYQIFARMKRTLDLPFLRYHYIVPKTFDLQEASINRIIGRSPPLCVRLIRPESSFQDLVNDNLYFSTSYFDTPIFLEILVDNFHSLDLSATPLITYMSQIKIPQNLLSRISQQDGNSDLRLLLNRETGVISSGYNSNEELSKLFIDDSMIALHLIDFAMRLQQQEVLYEKLSITWEIVRFKVIRLYINAGLTVDLAFYRSQKLKQVEWTAQYVNNNPTLDLILSQNGLVTYPWEEEYAASVVKHAIVVSRSLLRIQDLSDSLKRLYNSDLIIVRKTHFEYLLLLKIGELLNFGVVISFFDQTISLRDASSNVDDAKLYNLLQLPLFYDFTDSSKETTTTIQGLLSYIPSAMGGYKYIDRVAVRLEAFSSLGRELETYIEAISSYYFLHETLKTKSKDVQMKAAHERLSLHIILNPKDRFLFYFNSGSGITVRYTMPDKKQTHIKEFQKLSTIIFDQVKSIEPKDRMTATWCCMMLEMANVPEAIFSDIYKLLTLVLFKTEKSPVLLLLVPANAGSKLPSCGSNAFIIDKKYFHLLIQFKEGETTLLLPIKYHLETGHLSWWSENPIGPRALQQFEKQVFQGSKEPAFPGLHKAISSLVGIPLAKIRK